MNAHVRVDLDDDGPVVVKSATGPAAERLRHERERLERAVHPGVVALARGPVGVRSDGERGDGERGDGAVGTDGDSHELRTCYAGEPLSRWSGPLAHVAGLGAAVASALADIHDLGVVHGRLDATHILVGDDGRPRLCGLSHRGDAAPADDVAALGAVLADLVARAPAGRRGPLRRTRGASGERRALLEVVERATDPVPTRRPSARVLADAILSAVPAATLPAAAGRAPAARRARADASVGSAPVVGDHGEATDGRRGRRPDTLDRIWSFGDDRSDDERWAAAFGGGPPDLPPTGGPHPLPVAEVETPDWSAASTPDHRDPWFDDDLDDDLDDLDLTQPIDVVHASADLRSGDAHHARDAEDTHDDSHDLTREHRAATGRMSPVPRGVAGPDRHTAPRRAGRAARAVACLAVVGAVIAGAVVLGSGGGADSSRSGPPPAAGPPADCDTAPRPAADVDGDGCPEPLAVEGSTVDAGVATWSLGQAGDLVTVGDWDCDGDASAALLRPSTGDVFVFSAWAEVAEPVTVSSSRRVEGGVGIRAETGDRGCDRLRVDLAGGGAETVELPR